MSKLRDIENSLNNIASDIYDSLSNDVDLIKNLISLPTTNSRQIQELNDRIKNIEKQLNPTNPEFPIKKSSETDSDKVKLVSDGDDWVKLESDSKI